MKKSEGDRFGRAGTDAGTALDAFAFGDDSFVGFDFDRADRTGVNAGAATDASILIDSSSHFDFSLFWATLTGTIIPVHS
jgi:hypothetical protein